MRAHLICLRATVSASVSTSCTGHDLAVHQHECMLLNERESFDANPTLCETLLCT